LDRISRSSIGSLKPKHLQQSFMTAILDVLKNFIMNKQKNKLRRKNSAVRKSCRAAVQSAETIS